MNESTVTIYSGPRGFRRGRNHGHLVIRARKVPHRVE